MNFGRHFYSDIFLNNTKIPLNKTKVKDKNEKLVYIPNSRAREIVILQKFLNMLITTKAIVKEIQSYVEDTTDWLMKIKFDWRCSKHFIPCFSRCKINIYHYSIFQMHNESNPSKRPWKNILNKLLQQT